MIVIFIFLVMLISTQTGRGKTNAYVSRGFTRAWGWWSRNACWNACFSAPTKLIYLVDSVEGHKGPQLGVKM